MFFRKLFLLTVISLTTFCYASCYRILGVFPFPARSHFFLGSTLMKALAEAGHDVTIITPYKDDEPPNLQKNGSYREIVLEELDVIMREQMMKNGKLDMKNIDKMKGAINTLNMMMPLLGSLAEEILKHEKVSNLIHSNEKFDAVIVTDFLSDLLKLLAHHFDAPLVLFANNAMFTWYYDGIGNIGLPSINPTYPVEMPFRMSFSQRLQNLLEKIRVFIWFQSHTSKQNEIAKKYLPNAPSLEEMRKNVSLVLINSHFSTEVARQTTPCMINIGGFHIKSAKKLPDNLQKILDNASNGVIFFSFGTVIDHKQIPPETLQDVLQMLGKRKETVLWKFGEDLKDKPKNVHFGKWFPQQEILAHPNTKLFITHSGYSSFTEATYYGVPTVSIPFFGDQPANARFQVETGSGLLVNVENFSADSLERAIEEVLSNQTYKDAARRNSKIMRDRQNKPIDEAIFWVEYVARHRGAKHLRVSYLDMPVYEVYMLDILALTFAVLIVVSILVTYFIMKLTAFIKTRSNKSVSGKDSNKKKN